MRLTWRDAVATVLTAGATTLYIGQAADASWAPLSGVRATALAVLVLGLGACAIGGAEASRDSEVMSGPMPFLGSLTGVLLVGAAVSGWAAPLGIAVGVTCLLWLVTTVRHLRRHAPEPTTEQQPVHVGYRS